VNDSVGGSSTDPDFEAQFARLMQEVEQNRPAAVHEPSALERQKAVEQRSVRADGTGRHVARNAVIFVVLVGLVVGGAQAYRAIHRRTSAGSAANAAATGAATGSASATASIAVRSAATGATASTGSSTSTGVQQIPLTRLFPAVIKGSGSTVYTLVTSGKLADCVHSDMVGATLAGMFAQSGGCVGGEGALYKDAAKDQFDAFVFTMKDPSDVVSIMTQLSMNYSDVEMAPVLPPAGSDLASLSATSGIVQAFSSSGNYLGIFMAQWADGKASDYQSLENLLKPVSNSVGTQFESVS
jgi:hypothetical protein